jgi:hypothetical protein
MGILETEAHMRDRKSARRQNQKQRQGPGCIYKDKDENRARRPI